MTPDTVAAVYQTIRKSTGTLGGNGSVGALYGEVTMGSMQQVINYLKEHCALTEQSCFLDVGSGLGKPNFHVAQDPQVCLSVGVELEHIRWQLSMNHLSAVLQKVKDERPGRVFFLHMNINQAQTLNPFTHVYMYDIGFPPGLQKSLARTFNASAYVQWLISYQRYPRILAYGYKVTYHGQVSVHSHGSGEGHTVYFYQRTVPGVVPEHEPRTTLATRSLSHVVRCDPTFLEAVQWATGPIAQLRTHVNDWRTQYLSSGRPRRQKKEPQRNGLLL